MSRSESLRIAVLGSGAVGGYYGAKLARAGQQVTFIARGAHLRAIRDRGLLIWSPLGDFLVKAPAEEDTHKVGPVDLVIFAVKTYDTQSALAVVPPLLGDSTVVLTLQNGVDSVDHLTAAIGPNAVLGGATYVATGISAPGLIEQTGTHRRIVFGEVAGDRTVISPRVERWRRVLADADIEAEAVPDARVPLWEKFIYLAPFAAFTGAARLPIGPLWRDEHIRTEFLAAAWEVEQVARAEGVAVAPDLRDRIIRYVEAIPGTTRSSLLIDLSLGKRIEVDALQGAVVRRGRAKKIPTPIMSTLYAVLKPHELGARR